MIDKAIDSDLEFETSGNPEKEVKGKKKEKMGMFLWEKPSALKKKN